MKQMLTALIILLFLAACIPFWREVPREVTPEPSPTSAVCTGWSEGMKVRVAPETGTSIILELEGFQPGEHLNFLFAGEIPDTSSSRLESRPAVAVGEDGRFTLDVGLGGIPQINHWQGKIIHKRGVTCFEFTLPLLAPIEFSDLGTVTPLPFSPSPISANSTPTLESPTAVPETNEPQIDPLVLKATPAQSPTVKPTPDPDTILINDEPIATATYISVAGWSPDGRWLAYWSSDQTDVNVQQPYAMPGGTLHFWNAITSEMCAMSQFHTASDREAGIQWIDERSIIVVMPNNTYSGRPCQAEPFTLLSDYQPPLAEQSDPALSPNGLYYIVSTQTTSENGILTYETKLVTTDDRQELAAVTWQIDERLGDYSGWLGGEWASPTQFVIYETRRQGPLLLDVNRGVVSVLIDLLKLDAIPSLDDEAGFSLTARPVFSAETDAYHLLISGVGLEGNFPPVRLYHAESSQVETLPYLHVYRLLDLSEWIFLDSRPTVDGYETYEIWMRRLEDVDGTWQLLASDVDCVLWSQNQAEIAFTQGETAVVWQTFPDSAALGRWETDPYWTCPVVFSPDDRFVVTTGNKPGQWAYGLFVLER